MPSKYGLRADGTPKSTGFLGVLPIKNGVNGPGVASEFSLPLWEEGDPGDPGYEKGPEIPTLVPTLTKAERDHMTGDIIPNMKPVPDEIFKKARLHAMQRMTTGQGPFYDPHTEPRIQRRVRRSFYFK